MQVFLRSLQLHRAITTSLNAQLTGAEHFIMSWISMKEATLNAIILHMFLPCGHKYEFDSMPSICRELVL